MDSVHYREVIENQAHYQIPRTRSLLTSCYLYGKLNRYLWLAVNYGVTVYDGVQKNHLSSDTVYIKALLVRIRRLRCEDIRGQVIRLVRCK